MKVPNAEEKNKDERSHNKSRSRDSLPIPMKLIIGEFRPWISNIVRMVGVELKWWEKKEECELVTITIIAQVTPLIFISLLIMTAGYISAMEWTASNGLDIRDSTAKGDIWRGMRRGAENKNRIRRTHILTRSK